MAARIFRPLHGRARVWLPWRGSGSANYTLLKELCGDLTRPEYNRELKCFEVARAHLPTLIEHLPAELGQPLEVTLEGASQTPCVDACWNASPHTVWDCVCSCAGEFHGQGAPPGTVVSPGIAIATQYTTHTFTVTP